MARSESEYQVVARRYRPQQFDDLVGQEHVARALKNALTSDRVAHAYLFTGARGTGKTSSARILAKALNCVKGPTPTPCDKCTSCQAIAVGEDIDVREIDGASNRQIDDIRALRQDVGTRPTRGRYKIYIIDEVHMLTKEAFNALLKTLEEPPPHVKFIFATTDAKKVPITILSRCQRFDFGNISAERIAERLRKVVQEEKREVEDDALDLIARRAAGSMRDAQSLLDQMLASGGKKLTAESVQQLLGVAAPERIMALSEAIVQHDAKAALEQLQEFGDQGLQLGEMLDQLVEHWRDLMLVASAGKAARGLSTPSRFRESLAGQAAKTNLDTILAGLDILMTAKSRIRSGSDIQTAVEVTLIRLARLDDLAPLAQLAVWLSQPAAAPPVSGSKPTPTLGGKIAEPPEGKKKSPEVAAGPRTLTAENATEVWSEIVAQVGVMLGMQLQRAGVPAISGPNTLVLTFPAEYNAAYDQCGSSGNLQRIEAVVRSVTGHNWSIRLEKRVGPSSGSNGQGPHLPAPRQRPQEVMMQVPILQKIIEVFDALPMFVDPGFGVLAKPVETQPTPENSEED